jgi:hypothetical protein
MITLPMQAYGMTPREMQLAEAAASIAFARCVTGQREVSQTGLQKVRTFLETQPRVPQPWLFGRWNAEYIAVHGWQVPTPADPKFVSADPAVGKRCTQEAEYVAVQPISTTTLSVSGKEYAALIKYSQESIEKTHRDSRFLQLKVDFAKCVSVKGYTAEKDSDIASIKIESAWSSEEQLKAMLAEASCNDELRLTQQAGDINATYEQEYIKAHEAELIAIRKTADEHVAKAQQILREVGLS